MKTNNLCAVILAVEGKENCAQSLSLYLKVTIGGPSSIHRLALKTTTNCMDFLPSK